MADKFEKTSIYDVECTLESDGEEYIYRFKPLPFSDFPRVFDLMNELEKRGFFKETSQDSPISFLQKLDSKLITELIYLEKQMVKVSYPELHEDKLNTFVISNTFELIQPLMQVSFRQSKTDERKVNMMMNKHGFSGADRE